MGNKSPNNQLNDILMGHKPTTSSFFAEYFNFYLHQYAPNHSTITLGPTSNYVSPPVSNSELKGLADFIYKYLENN